MKLQCNAVWTLSWLVWQCLSPDAARALEIGVGTHFGQGKTDEQAFESWASAMRIHSMRDEIYWDHVERSQGVLQLEGDALRTVQVVRDARARGLRPLLVLDYGNELYRGGFPLSATARAAFVRYVRFVVETLRDSVEDFEVWNEWNLGAGSLPAVKHGSPEAYVELLKASSAAIRELQPHARVVGGAVGDDPGWAWMQRAIRAGMLQHVDAVSVHLYNFMQASDVRGVPELLRRLNSLHALLVAASPERQVPILITEVGWPNHVGKGRVEPLEAGAELLSLMLALGDLPYVAGVWLYEFRDGGADAREVEHNFGLVTREYHQKPISQALAYARTLLENSRTQVDLQTTGFRARVLGLSNGQTVLALWRAADNECNGAPVAVHGLSANAVPVQLGFMPPSERPRYTSRNDTWTVSSDALPQLFWLDSATRLSALSLSRSCRAARLNRSCALDSLKCVFRQ